MRIAASLSGTDEEERLQEDLLVGEGLTLVLLLPRTDYAGDRLATFIKRMRATPHSPKCAGGDRFGSTASVQTNGEPKEDALLPRHDLYRHRHWTPRNRVPNGEANWRG